MNFLSKVFFGVELQGFCENIQGAINHINIKDGIFTGDNLITFGRNLGFLQDEDFLKAWQGAADNEIEKGIVWRLYVLAWAAKSVIDRNVQGDFVECACYKGTTAKVLIDYVNFRSQVHRTYYLYDLFEHDGSMNHHQMPEHSRFLFDHVKLRFAGIANVEVIKGMIPNVLLEVAPEIIAFMHIDMNNAPAEMGALEILFDRLSPGGILVLDDYGWLAYRAQKAAEDPWLAKKGYQVLELPTGQGILFK